MSKISIEPITCPSCNYKGEYKMYESVNVTLDPKLRDRVLSGDIFAWECPKCGEALSIRYNLLYHDMDKAFQVFYSPNDCVGVNKMMNDLLTTHIGMRIKIRTVESLNALREKIFIFEQGLNDLAVELCKMIIKYSPNNRINENAELLYEKLYTGGVGESSDKLVFRIIIDGQLQEGMILYDKSNYNYYLNEVTTKDNFKMNNYCDTINEKWILSRIK